MENIEKDPQQVLKDAMAHEESSLKMYLKAAENSNLQSTKKLFIFLADEEKKHVEMLQEEYDKFFQKDN